ncbi:MAG: hypothetical protein CMJ85_02250 [Planctomycetes bacterium]|jgi:thymidylate synthase ThyX|nr:hypothetical protein [Planctomycetota bacterium]
MAEAELSALEKAVLGRFFSRTEPRDHADVYLVRKLPQEIRATLNGLYSRSHLSMRGTFLKRLVQGLTEAGKQLKDFSLPDASEDVLGDLLVDRSGKFLRTYAIDHGHNSLREGAVCHLAIENVSQLVTRFLQRERRASFEESSTRYISFSKEGHWIDPEIVRAGGAVETAYRTALAESFAFYQESIDLLRDGIRKKRPRKASEDEKAYERSVRAEAFDSARYLLTPALYTKFGLVCDARTLADLITQLVSHPLEEFRIVGARLREEGERDVPTLLTHAKRNTYLETTEPTLSQLCDELGVSSEIDHQPREAEQHVRLLSAPPGLDEALLASALFEHSDVSMAELLARVRALDGAERQALLAQCLDSRGPRDAMPEGFEGGGMLDFEILMDFGAYRDVARHRKGFQQQQRLTTAHGFVVPPLFDACGLGDRYRAVMSSAAEHAARVANNFPLQSQYLIPFGYLQRVRVSFDPRQMAYFCELRSQPDGHFSYRDIAIRMGHALRDVAPLFAEWVRVCEDEVFLGRVSTELASDARRAQREQRAKGLGFET